MHFGMAELITYSQLPSLFKTKVAEHTLCVIIRIFFSCSEEIFWK